MNFLKNCAHAIGGSEFKVILNYTVSSEAAQATQMPSQKAVTYTQKTLPQVAQTCLSLETYLP